MGRVVIVYVCSWHVLWDDARAASSYGYIEREHDYIKLCAAMCLELVWANQ